MLGTLLCDGIMICGHDGILLLKCLAGGKAPFLKELLLEDTLVKIDLSPGDHEGNTSPLLLLFCFIVYSTVPFCFLIQSVKG